MAYINGNEVLFSANVTIGGGVGDDIEPRVEALEEETARINAVNEKQEKRLANLELAAEGEIYAYDPKNNIAKQHAVPTTAMPYAVLDSIGGYTRKSKNLLKLTPNMSIPLTVDELPITYSTDKDGYFCIDGDGGVSGFFDALALFTSRPSSVTISARYIDGTVVGPADGVDADLCLLGNTIKAPTPQNPLTYLAVSNMRYDINEYNMAIGNFTNYKIALMVEEGTTATEYEPYFEGLKSAKVKAVKSYGKNLVPSTFYKLENWGVNGSWRAFTLPTIKVDGDYTLSIKKNPNKDWGAAIFSLFVSKDGGSTWNYPDGWAEAYMLTADKNKSTVTLSLKEGYAVRVTCYPDRQATLDVIMNVQFEKGSKATEYKPYCAEPIDTYTVPSWVQALNGYGANETYIDFGARAFVNGETVTPIAEITDTVYLMVEGNGYIVGENNEGIESNLGITYQTKLA